MTDLTDRLLRHADLHADQPWADDEQMQFARDLRDAAALLVSKAPTDTQKPVAEIMIAEDGEVYLNWLPDSGDRLTLGAKLYLAAPQAQPAPASVMGNPISAPAQPTLSVAKSIAAAQADDPSLWFVATTATEAHLQHALRHLAAAVEGTLVSPAPAQRMSDARKMAANRHPSSTKGHAMSRAGRKLQVGDEAYTNFNGGWKWVRITKRLENTGSQSGICFRTWPPVEQYAEPSARYDADWFEPAPKDAA